MTFKSLTMTPFCFEKSSVEKGLLNVLATFSVWFMLNAYLTLCLSAAYFVTDLLLIFANSLDPDLTRLNVMPDLDPNPLTL